MWLILVEAGVAMFVLIFIVWWTMFSGRKPERPQQGVSSGSKDKRSPALQKSPPNKDQ
ncbi:MAG: hypothetical protein JWR22_524 [Herminiimonas sp.]|nr:hypothetical protein [Herminiimonas sp.]